MKTLLQPTAIRCGKRAIGVAWTRFLRPGFEASIGFTSRTQKTRPGYTIISIYPSRPANNLRASALLHPRFEKMFGTTDQQRKNRTE